MNRLTEADTLERLKYLIEVLSDADRENRKPYIDDFAAKANLTRSATITWMIRRGYKPLGRKPKDHPEKRGAKAKHRSEVTRKTSPKKQRYVHRMPLHERVLMREFFSDLLWASNAYRDQTGAGPKAERIGEFLTAWTLTGGRANL